MDDATTTQEALVISNDDVAPPISSKTIKTRNISRQILVTIITNSLSIVCGRCLAYSAIFVPQFLEEQMNANQIDGTTSPVDILWITSASVFVLPISGALCGFTMDIFGRLNAMKLSAVPNIIGWALIALAQNANTIIIGRLITGLALGFCYNPAVVYVAEIGNEHIRGPLLSSSGIFVALGVLLVYFEGWLMNWRCVAWLTLLYSIFPVIPITFLPESPSWLISKGRTVAAKKSLMWFWKAKQNNEEKVAAVDAVLHELMNQHSKLQHSDKITLKEFLKPTAYKPFFILITLFIFQQFSGIYILTFNGVIFFKSVGVQLDPYLITVTISFVRLLTSIVITCLSNKFGRRHLMISSSAGMGFSMIVSALYTQWLQDESSTNYWVPACMVTLYYVFVTVGMQTIPFTITPELFPLNIRGVMQSLVYGVCHGFMFASLFSYYFLSNTFHGSSGLQYFFAVVSFGACIFTYVFLPETFDQKLIDIENYFWHRTVYL